MSASLRLLGKNELCVDTFDVASTDFCTTRCPDYSGPWPVWIYAHWCRPADTDVVFPRHSAGARSGWESGLVTRVQPIAGVERRARRLGEQIVKAFGDEPVHLIGHSMGGLDARRLLADESWHDRILSVTTIGTPHLGSSLADFAKLRSRASLPLARGT